MAQARVLTSTETNNNEADEMQGLMILLLTHWRSILIASLVGAALAYGISWLIPKSYESSATIYTRDEPLGKTAMAAGMMGVSLSSNNTSGYIMSIAESRPTKHMVAKSIKPEDASRLDLDIFPLPVEVKEDSRKGCIVLTCRTYDPHLSAQIVNLVLDSLGKTMFTSSKRKTQYLSKRLDETQSELAVVGADLRRFEETHNIALIAEDSKSVIGKLTEVEAEQLRVDALLQSMNSELANAVDPEALVDLKVRTRAQQAASDYIASQASELRRKISTMPAVAQQYAVLQRRMTVLEKTFELLSEQYQMASISQVGEGGDYEVIERAEPALQPASPRKLWVAIAGGCLAFMWSLAVLYVRAGKPRRSPG